MEDDQTLEEVFGDMFDDDDEEADEESPHADVIEEAEEKADKEDSSRPVHDKEDSKLERKMDRFMVETSMKDFLRDADEIERGLMRAVLSEIHSMNDFKRAEAMVAKQAAKLRSKTAEIEAEETAKVKEKVAKAWGVGPIGAGGVASKADGEKEIQEAIAKGDPRAHVAAIMSGDPFFKGVF